MKKFRNFLSCLKNTLLWLVCGVGLIALFFLGDRSTIRKAKQHPNRTFATVTECSSYSDYDSEGDLQIYYAISAAYETESGEQKSCTFRGMSGFRQVGSQFVILCNEDWEDPYMEGSLEPMSVPVKCILGGVGAIAASMAVLWLVKGIRCLAEK